MSYLHASAPPKRSAYADALVEGWRRGFRRQRMYDRWDRFKAATRIWPTRLIRWVTRPRETLLDTLARVFGR